MQCPAKVGTIVRYAMLMPSQNVFVQALLLNRNTRCNVSAGTLPASWGSVGAFPLLHLLDLHYLAINGTHDAPLGSPQEFLPFMPKFALS